MKNSQPKNPASKFQVGDKIFYVWGDKYLTDPENWKREETILRGVVKKSFEDDSHSYYFYWIAEGRFVDEKHIFLDEKRAEDFISGRIKRKIAGLSFALSKVRVFDGKKSVKQFVKSRW